MYHIFKLKQIKSIWNFSFMVSHTCTVYFKDMMVFTLTMQMYHRISVLVPVLVRVPEYLSTSTSTSTMTLELMSTSTVRVPEMQYSSTVSTSTEYEYPSPGVNSFWPSDTMWRQRSGSTLAQVMACCLMAPSHYLNRCSLIISEVQPLPEPMLTYHQ